MDKTKKNIAVTALMICINLMLFFVKLYIGLYTGSICIYTDAVNNLTDCLTCIVSVVGFCVLSKVKNEKYPFGFGRVQEIVTLITSAVIIVVGCTFLYSSLERLFYPMPVTYTAWYAFLLTGTAFVKLGMAVFLHFFIKKNPSAILSNMRLDSLLDFFISLVTVMSFTVSAYSGLALDAMVGIIISILFVISGIKILVPSLKAVVGRRNDDLCDTAKEFIESCNITVYSIQCHSYGNTNVYTACVSDGDTVSLLKMFKEKFDCELFVSFRGD